jgi:hypothetical protein
MATFEIEGVVARGLRNASRELRGDARATRDRARRIRARSKALRHGQALRHPRGITRDEALGSHNVRFVERG